VRSEGRVNVSLSFQAASTTGSVSSNILNAIVDTADEREAKQRGCKIAAQKKTLLLHPPGGVSAGFFERINHESGKSPYYSFCYFFFHDIQHTHTYNESTFAVPVSSPNEANAEKQLDFQHTHTYTHTHCMLGAHRQTTHQCTFR
jgi:hypothetical protein